MQPNATAPTPPTPHAPESSLQAVRDLSPEALFRYLQALAQGRSRADAERLAREVEAAPPEATRSFDVTGPARRGAVEQAREVVARWFAAHPGSGAFFVAGPCVCVEVREADADGLAAGLRRVARELGLGDAIARVDPAATIAQRAFAARRRPTLILRAAA